jgi:hypothetical protein
MDVDLVRRAAHEVASGGAAGLIGAATGHAGQARPRSAARRTGVTGHGRLGPRHRRAHD